MRSPFLRVVSLFAAILLAVGTRAALAQDELFVTNGGGDSVTVYARTANGHTAPLRTISGAATGLNGATGLAVDTVNNELVVSNIFGNSVTVYARTANGNVAPLRTISGAATGLNGPLGNAVDTVNNELAVANFVPGSSSVTVYGRTANGNVAPLRTLQGAATGLNIPVFVGITTGGAPPTPTPTNTPAGVATNTPTNTPTFTPTNTPTVTQTPTRTPTVNPSAAVVPTLSSSMLALLALALTGAAFVLIKRM